MAGMSAIRRALLDRLGTIPGVTSYPFIPDSINAPAVAVFPDRPFLDYQKTFRGNGTEWRFVVNVFVTRSADEESSQEELDDLLDPDGPIVEVLQDDKLDDALADAVDYVEPISANRYGKFVIGGVVYLAAEISIVVRS